MSTELKPYSVMLEYPDYMDGGTYYEHVSARSPKEAIAGTRDMCMKENWNDDEGISFIDAPEDLALLLIIEGHHNGIDPEGE